MGRRKASRVSLKWIEEQQVFRKLHSSLQRVSLPSLRPQTTANATLPKSKDLAYVNTTTM